VDLPALEPQKYCVRQPYLDVDYGFGHVRLKRAKEPEPRAKQGDASWFKKQE
jgi:hypothetical protein